MSFVSLAFSDQRKGQSYSCFRDLDLLRRMASSGVSSTVDAINEIRRTPHGISASGDALRCLLRCTVNFSTSASVVEALILRYCPKHFTVKKVNKMAATETLI